MPSYTASLRLIQPATGEYSGTWGTQVNTGITALVDSSIAGTTSITMTAANYTLTTANGAADESRAMFLVIGGTPGAAREVIVPAVSKLYFVTNNTTGGFAQTVKTALGSGISVPNGASMVLRCDGTNVVDAITSFSNLTLSGSISATKFIPTGGTATGNGMYLPAANTLAWSNNGAETMRLDASGRLSVGAPLAENSTGVYLLPTGEMRVKDFTEDGTSQISIYNNNATNDSEQFFVAMNGADVDLGNKRTSAALKIFNSNTERARIDSSGNLLVGKTATTYGEKFGVRGSGATSVPTNLSDLNGALALVDCSIGNAVYGAFGFQSANGGGAAVVLGRGVSYDTNILFCTNPSTTTTSGAMTERARITSGGDLLVGTTNASVGTAVGCRIVDSGARLEVAKAASTNSDIGLSQYSTGAAAYRFYVGYGGNIYATSTTITAISDQRLKENIRDLDAGLNAIMALKPRKFDWKPGKGKDIKDDRGFIAQEFEQVFPDLIDEWKDPAPEGEEPYKAVRADLIPVLVKAIQEQQAIIEDLRARVAALEAA